jgi:hypothetical protein
MSKVSFGFDDVKPRKYLPFGKFELVVVSSTSALVSRAGNPYIRMVAASIDPDHVNSEFNFRTVNDTLMVGGESAGRFESFLKAIGEDPKAIMAEWQANYDGDGSAKSVAEYFDEVVVPQLVDRTFIASLREKKNSDREPYVDEDGETAPEYSFRYHR